MEANKSLATRKEIQVSYNLPPTIINKKTQKVLPISLSHHGKFVAVLFIEK